MMCEVVEMLGGYQNFLETPIPVIMEFQKYTGWKQRRFFTNMQQLLYGKRRGKK